jgi:hypothetical protein
MTKIEKSSKTEQYQYRFQTDPQTGLIKAMNKCVEEKDLSPWEKAMYGNFPPAIVEKMVSKGTLRPVCEGYE